MSKFVVEYSNTHNKIGHIGIIYKIDNFEVHSSQLDGGFCVAESLHLTKGSHIVVIDMAINFNISTCGTTNLDFIDCDDFIVQTNCKKMATVISMIKLCKQNNDHVKGIKDIAGILDNIIEDLTDKQISDIYVKHPDTSIKTLGYITHDDDYYKNNIVV